MKNRCPYCKSQNLILRRQRGSSESVGKTVLGAAALGTLGVILSKLSGLVPSNLYHCNDCGRNFESRK